MPCLFICQLVSSLQCNRRLKGGDKVLEAVVWVHEGHFGHSKSKDKSHEVVKKVKEAYMLKCNDCETLLGEIQ